MEVDFKLDGVSARSKGIRLQKSIEFAEAQLNVTSATVAGRSGELHISDGTYKERKANALCFCLDAEDITVQMQTIMEFLFGNSDTPKYRKLSTDNTYYWRALVTSAGVLNERMMKLNVFNIAFTCKPFRYLFSGDTALTPVSGGTITNPTMFTSEPLIYITLSGAGTITVNDTVYNVSAPGGTVNAVIDCEGMDFRGTDGTNLNNLWGAEFPTFKSGANVISWSGGIAVTSVVPHWRTL